MMSFRFDTVEELAQNIDHDLAVKNGLVPTSVNAVAASVPPKQAIITQKPMSEADWQYTVIDLAHLYGWKVAHFRGAWSKDGKRFVTPVGADGAGFPDLVLARRDMQGRREWIVAELKAEDGQPSPEQCEWLELLHGYLWRPSDYDEIVRILK